MGNHREVVPNSTFADIIVRVAQRIKYLGKGSFEPEVAFEIVVYKPLGLTAIPLCATAEKPEPTSGASASNDPLRLMTRPFPNPKWYSMSQRPFREGIFPYGEWRYIDILIFSLRNDDLLVYDEIGSVWDFAGRAVDGPLSDVQLDDVSSRRALWF